MVGFGHLVLPDRRSFYQILTSIRPYYEISNTEKRHPDKIFDVYENIIKNQEPELNNLVQVEERFCPKAMVIQASEIITRLHPRVVIAQYVWTSRVLKLASPECLKIIDTHDKFSDYAKKINSFGIDSPLGISEREEVVFLNRSDIVISIQSKERESFARLYPQTSIITVGVDFEIKPYSEDQDLFERKILIVASGNAYNVHFVQKFINEAWNLIHYAQPDVKLRIIGKVCQYLTYAPHTGVELGGYVRNLDLEYKQATLVVNPVLAGTGLKIKAIEALAHSKALVSSPLGVEGLPEKANELFLVAKTPDQFAEQVNRLLGDSVLRKHLVMQAREFTKTYLSPQTVYKNLDEVLRPFLSEKKNEFFIPVTCSSIVLTYFVRILEKGVDMLSLSICIATRNRANLIGETLDSILSQANENIEVVVVDGASTDNTEQVVRERQAHFSQLRYLRLPVNGGFDQDYNRAVELAQGHYCWLMSDDDLLKPGAIATVLQAISANHDLIIVNWEVWNQDFTQRLLPHVISLPDDHLSQDDTSVSLVANYGPHLLSLPTDRLYRPTESQNLFIDMAMAFSFISIVVIKRHIWLKRDKASYFGTLFVHVGVIFQAPLAGTAFFIAQPQVATRYGDASWAHRHFEIWMFKWPKLVWAFSDYTEAAKYKISPLEPWRDLETLLMNRAIGVFSSKEFSRLLAPRLKSKKEFWILYLIARVPGWIVNLIYVAYISLFRLNGGFLLADIKNSCFYYRNYF